MIDVELRVWIVAADDAEADAVIRALHDLGTDYPNTPIISISERSRELER